MKPRVLKSERIKYNANGYELVRLYEDGTVLHNSYEHNKNDYASFHVTDSKKYQVKGTLLLQEVTFDENNKRKNNELKKHTKTLKKFSEKDYVKAHEELVQLHKDTLENLDVDYRLIFELDLDSVKKDVPIPKEVKTYPVTYFRATTNIAEIERKKHPENLAIRFVPTMNESLYFHYIPNNDHITMTGDNLFALATRHVKTKLSEQQFVEYVDAMVDEVENHAEYYHSLIKYQRNRRASLETDEAGDLYAR